MKIKAGVRSLALKRLDLKLKLGCECRDIFGNKIYASFIAVIKRPVLHCRHHGELDEESASVGRDDLHQDEPQRSHHHLCQAAPDEAVLCRHHLEG